MAASRHLAPLATWAPRGRGLAAYLHIPFCVARCGYCSFTTSPYRPEAMDRFLQALGAEIDLLAALAWAGEIELSTIFLGGGTPSLLDARALAGLLDRLRQRFRVAPGAEVTVECNPESVTSERLRGYRAAGVNRLSLGVQSLEDGLLRALGREHTASQARLAFDAARGAGFGNVSVDLIYGLPGLDLPTWERSVRDVLSWGPEHVSAYGLSLDEGSRWHAAGLRGLPAEETVAAQYWALAGQATRAGLEHYEISNYARPGRRAAHNEVYWRGEEYLGLGPGACGFLGRVRYANVTSLPRYWGLLEAGAAPLETHETLTPRQRLAERLILGLRLAEGVPVEWLEARVALESGRLPQVLEAWRDRDLLRLERGRARLTEAGFLLSDALFVELL